jgi:hypothetical protein
MRYLILSHYDGDHRWWTIITEAELAVWKADGSIKPGDIIVPLREEEIQRVVEKTTVEIETGLDLSSILDREDHY